MVHMRFALAKVRFMALQDTSCGATNGNWSLSIWHIIGCKLIVDVVSIATGYKVFRQAVLLTEPFLAKLG